jgi:predicted DNA-binding ribbon-helix-helix protein
MPGKRIQLDPETWAALDLLARDRMMDFQELADEAFRDLLHKHGRPTDLKSALRESVRATTRAKPERSKPERSKPEPSKPEPSKPEPSKPEPSKPKR